MRKGILWRWYHVDVFWYLLCGVGIEKIEYIYIYIYTFKRLSFTQRLHSQKISPLFLFSSFSRAQ